jgi:methyl-accepting chemotaxis protein
VGRGFSLVAAEMRRLSEHVMDSVRDIRKLVADMRAASHASVLATEESIKLAKEAALSANKISDAVTHQREGTGQVKGAADEIVRVVNSSLDGTAQITRSAEALLQLSHELKSEAGAFRIDR